MVTPSCSLSKTASHPKSRGIAMRAQPGHAFTLPRIDFNCRSRLWLNHFAAGWQTTAFHQQTYASPASSRLNSQCASGKNRVPKKSFRGAPKSRKASGNFRLGSRSNSATDTQLAPHLPVVAVLPPQRQFLSGHTFSARHRTAATRLTSSVCAICFPPHLRLQTTMPPQPCGNSHGSFAEVPRDVYS